jgi:hypothetical protein
VTPAEVGGRILGELKGALAPLGFRVSGHTFSRASHDLIHLLQLQGSRGNTAAASKFTVNVAVWVPALVPEDVRDVRKPSVDGAHWRERLGFLSPERTDLWWHASDRVSADEIAREITTRVKLYAIPAMAALPNSAALLATWRSGVAPGLTRVQVSAYASELADALAKP